MSWIRCISFVLALLCGSAVYGYSHDDRNDIRLNFYGDSISMPSAAFIDFDKHLSEAAVLDFYRQMDNADYEPLIDTLLAYREENRLDDWLYYQLIRNTAEAISPKKASYVRYTLYKWFFLLKSGYDAELAIAGDTILFYVQCDENLYDIPYHIRDHKQYVCLNYHDYGYNLDFQKLSVSRIPVANADGKPFSYKLTHAPEIKPSHYQYKNIEFEYQDVSYRFNVKLNDQVKSLYANYPVADYQLYFNVPMSKETYDSFIPKLKNIIADMNTRSGVDYLMRFTRYAFLYQSDKDNFGKEKRLSPEQTLLSDRSDCEDRAALFFFLVKEMYHLPMIVLAYPSHVTIAVKLDKAPGKPIIYNGDKYYICEPTPQARDMGIGEVSRKLRAEPYEIAYAYKP